MKYEDYIKKLAKKEARKARKAREKARKLELAKDTTQFIGPVQPPAPQPEVKSYTATGQPSRYTEQERAVFAARIDNEKKNIWRQCSANADEILKFCEENKADERNAAVRYAREAAVKWASTQVKVPF